MKSAITLEELEDKLEDCVIKGRIYIPDRKEFSVAQIYALLYAQCPLEAPSDRQIQRKIRDLKDLGETLGEFKCGNTPFFDRFGTEMIINKLKFKVKNPCKNPLEVTND